MTRNVSAHLKNKGWLNISILFAVTLNSSQASVYDVSITGQGLRPVFVGQSRHTISKSAEAMKLDEVPENEFNHLGSCNYINQKIKVEE